MALQCQLYSSTTSYTPGQTPVPQAFLTVYNPNAFAVTVQSVQIVAQNILDLTITSAPGNGPVVATGPGQLVTCPALSSITIGPISLAGSNVAAGFTTTSVNQAGNPFPINPQPSQRLQTIFLLAAIVQGSDGSSNLSGTAPVLLSYYPPPQIGVAGGFLNFAGPNNMLNGLTTGTL